MGSSDTSLAGRVALVTGASRGIGRGVAVRLAAAGADVSGSFLSRADEADAVRRDIEATGRRAVMVQADVASRADVRRHVGATLATLGRLDVVVVNAGILQQRPFRELTDDDLDRMLAVNLKGPLVVCQEVMDHVAPGGSIILIGSIGGQVGGTLAVHYAATKAAIVGLARSMARLLAPHVRVNCVAPGLVETEMTAGEIASEGGQAKLRQIPLQRAGLAAEIAESVLFLASDASSYITGHTLNVNGGLYLG